MGYTLKEVKANQKHLSFNSFCVYKPQGSEDYERIPVSEVLCIANIGDGFYTRNIFTSNKPSDSYLEDMLRRGIMVEEKGIIHVSDKAKNATYLFFCPIPSSKK